MTRIARALITLLLVVGALALAACGGSDSTTSGVTHIVVKNKAPVGGVAQIRVKKGDPVKFTVQSDAAQEIHVHGYDFHRDVPAGGTVSFDFPAKIDGAFEIELEEPGVQIANLQVTP
jgi:plastocyanin